MAALRFEQLRSHGWEVVDDVSLPALCQSLATLGRVARPHPLAPTAAMARRPRSLSAIHGTGPFPLHTDGASRAVPPLFIALWAEASHPTATTFADGNDETLAHPVFSRGWLVAPGGRRKPFYSIPRSVRNGRVVWRLNTDCMAPAVCSTATFELVEQRLEEVGLRRVEWVERRALLLDNRRMLHGRESLGRDTPRRRLWRVEVAE